MHISVALLLELGLILAALSALGALARRFALTPVPLYLLAGLALGEGGIASVPSAAAFVEIGGTIGVVLFLLTLGLEFSVDELAASLHRHLPAAVVDLLLNATPGAVAGWLLGLNVIGILALAGATWVSSSGIVARMLDDLGRVGNRETPAVLSVLVLEDFAMAAYLPLLTVLAADGTVWRAGLGMLVAVTAVIAAFAATRRWSSFIGRMLSHPEPEQLLLRVLGTTLVVAGLAELVGASAAVGAFLVGLTLTGPVAARARAVLTPLRDLFAAAFFLAIGLGIDPGAIPPVLPAAFALAAVTAATKLLTGAFAASRDSVAWRGQLRAGTALIPRGEFSIVILGLTAAAPGLAALLATYVLIVATGGPLIARGPGLGSGRIDGDGSPAPVERGFRLSGCFAPRTPRASALPETSWSATSIPAANWRSGCASWSTSWGTSSWAVTTSNCGGPTSRHGLPLASLTHARGCRGDGQLWGSSGW